MTTKTVRERIEGVFHPLDWQIPVWRDRAPILLLTGSAGGGKSQIAAEKINAYLKAFPNAMGLVVRKTRESMENSTVLFMNSTVMAGDSNITHKSGAHRWEYSNSSVLAYGGMKDDEQREQIRSIGLAGGVDIIWVEEANKLTERDFNELLARLRGTAAPWQQIILSCNPDAATHWINQRLIQGGQASVHYSSAKDNPHNPPSYLEYLEQLTGLEYKRLVLGQWCRAEGVVWEEYDPAIHLIDQFPIPKDWRRFRVIDFGYTNPFVCQWWAEDGDGRLYRYREIYHTGLLVEDTAEMIALAEATKTRKPNKTETRKGYNKTDLIQAREFISTTVCDHDAEDRKTLEKHLRLCGASGTHTAPADKAVTTGIQKVAARLRVAGDGKPRLFLLKNSLCHSPDRRLKEQGKPLNTEQEIPQYVWHDDLNGKPNKEEPVKENDHGCDDLRYMVMRLDGRAEKRVIMV